MKTLTTALVATLLLPLAALAQPAASQAYWVHEDPVYPAKVADYESYCYTLASRCRQYNIQETSWFTLSTDDLTYFHVTPIENMADLDQSRFSVLQDNMGEEEFDQLFVNFDSSYDTHSDYIIHLDKELSYMPEERLTSIPTGPEFRKLEFWYTTPQNFEKVIELATKFKELYSRKNSPEQYRLYRSGFGANGQYILVSIPADSPADYERIRKENKELLGAERDKIYNEFLKYISKVETYNGYMREDLSYTPTNTN